jgi:hypothetical protein
MKGIQQLLRLALFSGVFSTTLAAQQAASDTAQIEKATATYSASHFLSGDIAFDPTRNEEVNPSVRSSAEAAQLSVALRAKHVGNTSQFYSCSGEMPSTCRINGADVVVSMNRPEINGDTAFVIIRTLRPTTSARSPVVRQEIRLRLERRSGTWVVTDRLGGSIT